MTAPASPPLAGITVVSLEHAVAAPYATRQLADLGARVIKVERPEVGDFARSYDETVRGQSSYFMWLNRSKESLALDLKEPRANRIVNDLLAKADVFVENLAPGATQRMGLDSAELMNRYPNLIVCKISGYGTSGPWQDRKAYDLLIQCETGLVSITGSGDVLAKVGISIADIAAGTQAYSGVLAALFRRTTTGVASKVEVSLFDALTEWMGQPYYYTMYSGQQPSRVGVEHPTIAPYGLFKTRDGGAIVLAVQNEREWESFCTNVLGDRSIGTDPRFSTNSARVTNRAVLLPIIESAMAAIDAIEAAERLDRATIAHARVNSIEEALNHPVLSGRQRWRDIDSPAGSIRAILPPTEISGLEPCMNPVPAVGQHSRPILSELGYSEDEIVLLEKEGVISSARLHREGVEVPGS